MKRVYRAVWTDPSVPDLSGVLTDGLGIDPAEFAAALAPHLRLYRIREALRTNDATREESVASLDALARTLQDAAEMLEPDRLPSLPRALMQDDILDARRELMHEFCERVQSDLYLLVDAAKRVRPMLAPARKGRRQSLERDRLLATTTQMLRDAGIKAAVAQALARDVLLACNVPVPVNVKRAARKGQK